MRQVRPTWQDWGAQTRDALAAWGFAQDEIAALEKEKAIGRQA